jgi:hypothetical protein
MVITSELPDVGILKQTNRSTSERAWIVILSINGLSSENARRLAAELINAADQIDKLNDGQNF